MPENEIPPAMREDIFCFVWWLLYFHSICVILNITNRRESGMGTKKTTRELLAEHYKAYPELEIVDIFKFIFQGVCGCEHFVTDKARAEEYIRRELEKAPAGEPKIEPLDGDYSRVHLSCIGERLSCEALARAFCASARAELNTEQKIRERLDIARAMIAEGALPFSSREFDASVSAWAQSGYCAVHHSDTFREKYKPAYRVIHNEFLCDIEESDDEK